MRFIGPLTRLGVLGVSIATAALVATPSAAANSSPRGPYGQVSLPSVTFDAKHNVWLISSLGLSSSGSDVLTSRSTDGGLTWEIGRAHV